MQLVSNQRVGKHASTVMELLPETVFSIRSVQSVYKEDNWGNQFSWELKARLWRKELQECSWEKKTVRLL
jgi:hypothetical protein